MPSTNKIIDLSALAYFKAKLDLILASKADASDIPTVNNASLTIQKNGTTVETFYANDNTNKTANIVVPTATSDLTNDSDFQNSTEVSAAIAAAIPTVNNAWLKIQKNGTTVETFYANDNTNKTANIVVPTATSDLTNDSGYQTASDVSSAITTAISGITSFEFQIVQALPATGEKGIIYLLAKSGTAPDIYDEYIWVTNSGVGSFEKIGSTDVDLSGYVQFTDILYADNTDIDNLFV